ncbi:MFS transporter [Cryptosporangium minutisporangium]|uniref:MFS transporter n=1 Tax=Cryptosporangium minutisporangium TaxID=113569 RepID=A0ABP6SWN0_9ACTN
MEPGGDAAGPAPSWRRDFRLLWVGTTLTQLGGLGTIFAYPLLALAMTESAVFAGWVVFAGMLPATLLYLPAGVLADRLDRRIVLVVSAAVRGAAAVVLPLMLFTGHDWALLIPIVAFVDGTCATLYAVTEAALVPRLVPPEALSGAIARNEARFHLAMLVGRPLGGLLYGLSRALPFVVNVVAALTAAVLAGFVRGPTRTGAEQSGAMSLARLRADLGVGLAWVRRHQLIRLAIAHDSLQNFLMQAVGLVVIARAVHQGLPAWFIGLVMAAGGGGGVLGSLVAPTLLRGRSVRQVLTAVAWAWAGFASCLPFADRGVALVAAFLVYGLIAAHTNVAMANYQARAVPPDLLGRVISVDRSLSMGAVPLGGLAAGYALPVFGAQGSLTLLAMVGAGWAVLLTARLRRIPAAVAPVTAG